MERNCVKCETLTNADLCGKCNQKVLYSTYINGKLVYVFDDNTTVKVYPASNRAKPSKELEAKGTVAFPVKKKLPKL